MPTTRRLTRPAQRREMPPFRESRSAAIGDTHDRSQRKAIPHPGSCGLRFPGLLFTHLARTTQVGKKKPPGSGRWGATANLRLDTARPTPIYAALACGLGYFRSDVARQKWTGEPYLIGRLSNPDEQLIARESDQRTRGSRNVHRPSFAINRQRVKGLGLDNVAGPRAGRAPPESPARRWRRSSRPVTGCSWLRKNSVERGE